MSKTTSSCTASVRPRSALPRQKSPRPRKSRCTPAARSPRPGRRQAVQPSARQARRRHAGRRDARRRPWGLAAALYRSPAMMRRLCPAASRGTGFLKLWAAETVSLFGSQVSQLALPLVAIILLDASAFEVSALRRDRVRCRSSCSAFPQASGSTGSAASRSWSSRDLGRALLLGSIPLAHWLDVLTLGHLYVVGFLVGFPPSSSTSPTSRTSRRSSRATS